MTEEDRFNNRILIVDDNPSIHEDFQKILPESIETSQSDVDALIREVLGKTSDAGVAVLEAQPAMVYNLCHANQGQEAIEIVDKAEADGEPIAVTFMDVRMPPGLDGIETIRRIWETHPYVEMVICTAYSDYSWEEILSQIGSSDQLQFLRKPFEVISVKQMALALTKKWNLGQKSRQYTENLESQVAKRTKELKKKVAELEKALAEIKQLRGILPMCAYCQKVRDDDNFWQKVDSYLQTHTDADISHGVCPECYEKVLMKEIDKLQARNKSK